MRDVIVEFELVPQEGCIGGNVRSRHGLPERLESGVLYRCAHTGQIICTKKESPRGSGLPGKRFLSGGKGVRSQGEPCRCEGAMLEEISACCRHNRVFLKALQ